MAEIPESQLSEMLEIYRDQTGKTFIYFAKWNQPGSAPLDVAVKEIFTQGMLEPYTYIEECSNQLRIDSPHVCKIYGWNLQAQKVMIVMERLQGDLAKEIFTRREQNYFFREEELLDICRQVVSVFAELQRMNISHSDIKAENIFVHKSNGKIIYKVGDFGSAGTIRAMDHMLTGTPLYLSPILKREYALYNQTKQRREIRHNPFKSDVFSLGVTLIFAAELIPPNDLLDLASLGSKLEAHISTIAYRYPGLSRLLRGMLQTDESQRCDFKQMRDILIEGQDQAEISRLACELTIRPVPTSTESIDIIQELNRNYIAGNLESIHMLLQIEISSGSLKQIAAEVKKDEISESQGARQCRHCLSSAAVSELKCKVCMMNNGQR